MFARGVSAILRQNAAVGAEVKRTGLGGGGGAAPALPGQRRVDKKGRYSKDPAAELMPAAEFLGFEPDFAAVLEDFQGSPFDPQRRRVLGKLAGVFAMDYQGARSEERRFLRRLLLAGNPKEGYAANRALHLLGVSPVIRRTLALGVAETRAERGAGFLGAVQARLAATTFRLLGPEGREQVWNLLTLAGCDAQRRPLASADRVLERALVLKAVAARRHQLGPWSARGPQALYEVVELAEAMRGAPRAQLAAYTTLHSPEARGPLAKLEPAPRVLAQARGDVDPVFAWRQHGAPRLSAQAEAGVGASDDALPDLDRGPLLDRPRLHQALAEARVFPERLALSCVDALTDYLAGRALTAERLALKDEAVARLAKRGYDVVRAGSIEAIRTDSQGIYRFDAARALGDLMSRYSGATYLRRVFSDQVTAGADPLAQLLLALDSGLVVPLSVGDPQERLGRAYAILERSDEEDGLVLIEGESREEVSATGRELLAPALPAAFGRRARADTYFAPAALDLLAPPFGLRFAAIGIEDQL